MLVEIARRQAKGARKGGRYNKHDTARARFIKDKALMGLRLGILVHEADLKMIRLPPLEELKQRGGADWIAMGAWAQEHGRDPRKCYTGVAIATGIRSHCRPGFFRVFDLGDHVGAEGGQLREAGHRRVAGETWLRRSGRIF